MSCCSAPLAWTIHRVEEALSERFNLVNMKIYEGVSPQMATKKWLGVVHSTKGVLQADPHVIGPFSWGPFVCIVKWGVTGEAWNAKGDSCHHYHHHIRVMLL